MDTLIGAIILIVILIFSLSFHEAAHAYIAHLFGDDTAKKFGRLTLNPLAHWDKFGTTLLVVLIFLQQLGLPVIAFGWGKPVPVNESKMDNPKLNGMQVALAGPFSNFVLAVVIAFIYRFTHQYAFSSVLLYAITINIYLMFFNLIPAPPLDGSSILRYILPEGIYYSLLTNPIVYLIMIFLLINFALTPISNLTTNITGFLIGG